MQTVSVLRTKDYQLSTVRASVRQHFATFDLTGKLDPQTKVLLKPNLLMRRRPEEATTTHPALVEAVALELQELGVQNITLADSSGGLYTKQGLEGLYRTTGMAEVAARAGIALNYDTTHKTVSLPQGETCKELSVIQPVLEADFIINLAKVKTHGMTTMTGSAKNLFGTVPGLQKPELHFRFSGVPEFCNMLVDLAQFIAPTFTLVDGVVAMEGDGPSGGIPKEVGVTLAGDDVFALDRVQCALMGMEPDQVPTVAHSIRRGLCPANLEEIDIVGDGFAEHPFLLPKGKNVDFLGRVPGFLRRPAAKLKDTILVPTPKIRKKDCIGCGRCAESCPAKTITLVNGKAVIHYDNCIRCFCCHELCPPRAIDIRRFGLFR